MAYSVNGKVYTDHPLMDEICFYCKKILKGIVIKNDVLANKKETINSIDLAEAYYIYSTNGYIKFELYPFNYELLHAYGYDNNHIRIYLDDRYKIPDEDRENLTDFANKWFVDNFFDKNGVPVGEENDYYRMLIGLPPFDTGTEYFIEINEQDIPASYKTDLIHHVPGDASSPYYIHEQNDRVLSVLYASGYIDGLKETYKGFNYSYINFLGSKSIDLLTARKASKWDILYIPNVYYTVEDRFTELYRINREIYVNRSYQEYFAEMGEYYDQLMIVCVLCQTFADLITEVPEWYIRRDIFDIRSCQYFLESYGVEFFKEIPLKYQIKIIKNLNKIIKYKSSNKNTEDILDIFTSEDTYIYKYWLYKKRKTDKDGNYVESSDISKKYELEFISSKIGESYDNYIKDSKYITPYDDITLNDKYWDGEDTHEYIKNKILNQDFTIQGTKYMSIEYHIPLEKYLYEMEYFLGLILDSNIYTDDITIPVPSIDENTSFKLSDLFLYLIVLTNSFNRTSMDDSVTKVIKPDSSIGKFPVINEEYYDWKKKYLPEIYVPKKGRIYGFNGGDFFNINYIVELMERRHSHLEFGRDSENKVKSDSEYRAEADKWIEDLGIFDYINPASYRNSKGTRTLESVTDLYNIYENNTKIYNKISDAITNAENQDDKKTLEYVFQELFTKEFDEKFYLLSDGSGYANDLVDVLKDRDFILYQSYYSMLEESNIDARKDLIRSIMNDVITALEYIMQGYNFKYLFNFTSTESFSSIIKYVYLMINFFKSYKVYFLDPYITYESSNKLENRVDTIDNIEEWRIGLYRSDKSFSVDKITSIEKDLYKKDYIDTESKEITDIYQYYDPDPLSDLDFNGLDAEKGESEETKDINGGIADDTQNVPYIMVNGGASYLGTIDFSNINGGDASELFKEYFEVDGGEAYDPDALKTDAMGSQKFTYIIDGGAAGKKEFISNTVHLKLKGTELLGNIIISPRNAYLKILDDGLYMSSENFADKVIFENLVNSAIEITDIIRTEGVTAAENIEVLLDKNKRIMRINKVTDSILYNFEYVLEQMENDFFVNNIKSTVDSMCNELRVQYEDFSPFAWEDL